MSLMGMMDSVCNIYRPSSVTRDANQGQVQVFTTLQAALPCSQQQMGASMQQVYAQNNAFVGTTIYFPADPLTHANDRLVAQSIFDGVVNQYLVAGSSFPVARGVLWGADCTMIQAPTGPAYIVSPVATNIMATTATLGATVQSDGGSDMTASGIIYSVASVNSYPIIGGAGVTDAPDLTPAVGAFTVNVAGLVTGTMYAFRAYVITGAGTTYGPVTEFTTL